MYSRKIFCGSLALALLTTLIGIVSLVLYCFPAHLTKSIDKASISRWGGHAYVVVTPEIFPKSAVLKVIFAIQSDSSEAPVASTMEVFENGAPLGSPHAIHAEIAEKGLGRFSHWGSNIIFSTTDNSSPIDNGRTYSVHQTVSMSWWLPLLLIVSGVAGLCLLLPASGSLQMDEKRACEKLIKPAKIICRLSTTSSRPYLFWGVVAMLWLYLNIVLAQVVAAPIPSPDTQTYMEWSLFRTIGYPALLHFYHLFFGSWAYLHIFQLNLLLAGLFSMTYAIARISGSYVVGWLFLALIFSAGNMLSSATDMMTEAAFSGFVMLHLSFVYLLLMEGRKIFGLFAGLALAAAILIKSVAVVFLGPLFLFLMLAPKARKGFLILVLPAVAAWLAPSAYNYARNGIFESSAAGGFALGGHVAWGIRPYPGSDFSKEAKLIEDRLKPILAERPSEFKSIDEYINYTSNEYNGLLYANIIPILNKHYSGICPSYTCTWRKCEQLCMVQENRTLLQLSKEAIANNPSQYAKQVLIHFYGLWRYTFRYHVDFLNGTRRRAESLPRAYSPEPYQKILASLPSFKSDSEWLTRVSHIENGSLKRIVNFLFLSDLFDSYVTSIIDRAALLVFVIGFIASAFVFRLQTASTATIVFCYTGLLVNAYFLGTAMAQPALVRYAWPMQGAVAALIFLGLALMAKAMIARLGSAKTIFQTSCRTRI